MVDLSTAELGLTTKGECSSSIQGVGEGACQVSSICEWPQRFQFPKCHWAPGKKTWSQTLVQGALENKQKNPHFPVIRSPMSHFMWFKNLFLHSAHDLVIWDPLNLQVVLVLVYLFIWGQSGNIQALLKKTSFRADMNFPLQPHVPVCTQGVGLCLSL